MIQFPNYLTLDRAKPVGGMCQQLRWYIHTNYCFDFALKFIIHSSLLACIHALFTILFLWLTHFFLYSLNIFITLLHVSSFSIIHLFIVYTFHFTLHLCLFILFFTHSNFHKSFLNNRVWFQQLLFTNFYAKQILYFHNFHVLYIFNSKLFHFSFQKYVLFFIAHNFCAFYFSLLYRFNFFISTDWFNFNINNKIQITNFLWQVIFINRILQQLNINRDWFHRPTVSTLWISRSGRSRRGSGEGLKNRLQRDIIFDSESIT